MLSSCQDTFIPFHCVRSEVNPSIQSNQSQQACVYQEMVEEFWKNVDDKQKVETVIKKFDIYYDVLNIKLVVLIYL